MIRIDYLNDPNAPAPNSIVPAATTCASLSGLSVVSCR